MRILIANDQAQANHFQRVAVFTVRKNGTLSLPRKYCGTLESAFIRQGAKKLTEESAVNFIDYRFGSSPTWRVSRVD